MTDPLIGLEIHLQLNTASKVFCSCRADCGAAANSHVCPVCMGYPGALPVLNAQAVVAAVQLGLALDCTVNKRSQFDRKHYFYPDLPKGYQITQYFHPICSSGNMELQRTDLSPLHIHIDRIHIEEDSAKSIHYDEGKSLIDFNRAGVPLLELVTAPDFHRGQDAAHFVKQLQQLVRYLELCDGKLEDGSLRCDVNISVSGNPSRSEVKNLNSLHGIREAIEFEITRLQLCSDDTSDGLSQTMAWDEKQKKTILMRSKESSTEYSYQPEPDLLPLILSSDMIQQLKAAMPELPHEKRRRFSESYGLEASLIDILTENQHLADIYEHALFQVEEQTPKSRQRLAYLITGELKHILRDHQIELQQCSGIDSKLAGIINYRNSGSISSSAARHALQLSIEFNKPVDEIISEYDLNQQNDKEELESLVLGIIGEHADAVQDIRTGKAKAMGFLMGELMRKSAGKANPVLAKEILEQFIMQDMQ
jgi:aspartyl-tRNA(Asn)/glutamyl-tRNA(Gln) amidotransferase subunit B